MLCRRSSRRARGSRKTFELDSLAMAIAIYGGRGLAASTVFGCLICQRVRYSVYAEWPCCCTAVRCPVVKIPLRALDTQFARRLTLYPLTQPVIAVVDPVSQPQTLLHKPAEKMLVGEKVRCSFSPPYNSAAVCFSPLLSMPPRL